MKVPFGSELLGSFKLPLIPIPASIPVTAGKKAAKAAQQSESVPAEDAEKTEKFLNVEKRKFVDVETVLENHRIKIGDLTETINMLQSLDVELEKQRELMK